MRGAAAAAADTRVNAPVCMTDALSSPPPAPRVIGLTPLKKSGDGGEGDGRFIRTKPRGRTSIWATMMMVSREEIVVGV